MSERPRARRGTRRAPSSTSPTPTATTSPSSRSTRSAAERPRAAARDRPLRGRRHGHAARREPRQARPLRLDPQRALSRPQPGHRCGERPPRGDRQRAAAGEHVLDLDRPARPLPARGVVRIEPGRRSARSTTTASSARRSRSSPPTPTRTRSRSIRPTASPSRPASAAASSGRCASTPRAAASTTTPRRPGARAPGAGPRHFVFHPTDPFVFLLNELDATIDVLELDRATGTLRGVSVAPALPPRFAGGAPWAADLHLTPGRPLPLRQRAPLEHARVVRDRRRARHARADRDGADRERAARLRDLARRPLADRRRPGLASPQPLRDRRRERRASPRRQPARRPQPELGRDRRAAALSAAPERPSAIAIAVAGVRRARRRDGHRPLRVHAAPADDAARRRRRPACARAGWRARTTSATSAGALLCTFAPLLWARLPGCAPIDGPALVRAGLAATGRAHAGDGAAVAGGLAGAALRCRRRQRDGVRLRLRLVPGAARARGSAPRSAARCSPGPAPASSPAACSRARWSRQWRARARLARLRRARVRAQRVGLARVPDAARAPRVAGIAASDGAVAGRADRRRRRGRILTPRSPRSPSPTASPASATSSPRPSCR